MIIQVPLTLQGFILHVSHFTRCLYFFEKNHYMIPSVYTVLILNTKDSKKMNGYTYHNVMNVTLITFITM